MALDADFELDDDDEEEEEQDGGDGVELEDLDTFGEEDGDLGKSEGAHPARLPREGAKASPAEGGGDTQLFTPPEREMRFVDMDD